MGLTWRQLQEEMKNIPEDRLDEEILLARQKWGISYENHHIEKIGQPEIIRNETQADVVQDLGCFNYKDTGNTDYAIITSPY